MGAAGGKQSDTEALCQPPPIDPPQVQFLKAKMTEIGTTSKHMVEADFTFRQTSTSTYFRLLLSFVVQVGLMVGLALWQLRSLKQFLRAKKVV